jgi:hypothetical protein
MLPKPTIRKELADEIRECSALINQAELNGEVFVMVQQIAHKNQLIRQAFIESNNTRKVQVSQ